MTEPYNSRYRPRPAEALPELDPVEREIRSWQLDVDGFGELGQRRVQATTVLISRVGGLGGMVALELAAAGIGGMVLAHGGSLRANDLNRQVLMSHAGIGKPRIDLAAERLLALNPRLRIQAVASNVTESNVRELVEAADVIVDCAPLFEERYLLNREAVAQRKPMVECAVYGQEFHLTTILPGETPCLRCLYPEPSTTWVRRFPVLGAVSGAAGCLAAMEVIKLISGCGEILRGRLLAMDLRTHQVTNVRIRRLPRCLDCGDV
ncbi:MAG: HesA/MoeB/ThiF family protein [Verrucomicrobiales bacterium]|nr:HesA/MoeB/ThiF family protein [Verrucomicrobiales bacterium]